MKKFNYFRLAILLFAIIAVVISSCKKDEGKPEVIAGFTFTVDATNFKIVHFTNTSSNYSSLSWNFGDNSAPSTEANPVHTFAAEGDYTVTLTAKSTDGNSSNVYTKVITIADPDAELTKLVGDVSKTWKLIRDVSTMRFPIQCGPWGTNDIWWAMGNGNDELANRPCMLNDEWTFGRDGLTMVYDPKGDYWAEGGVFATNNICASTADPMTGVNGEDLSAWGGGNFTFSMTSGTNQTLTVNGVGAFVGFCKLTNGKEIINDTTATGQMNLPESITYSILKLTDGDVDTLIIQGQYQWNAEPGGYWRFVLVHYDDPNAEPPIPSHMPTASFTMEINGMTANFTSTSQYGESFAWDFGDGASSTEENPTHTYASQDIYTVTLTVTNTTGSSSANAPAFIGVELATLTEDMLMGNAWKPRVEEKSIFVGPGMGSSAWWSVPKNFLDGSTTGTDDWSCITNDEFTFSAGGVYTYAANADVRNDGYFGSPNGCWEESALSGNGLAFASGTHSFVFTPAAGLTRPIITLTNGVDRAAFIGFYKGYYGGENGDSANPPNGGNLTNIYEVMGYANTGTKEYLFVTVDISADHSGGAAWSVILER